jgi:hypothetical protein
MNCFFAYFLEQLLANVWFGLQHICRPGWSLGWVSAVDPEGRTFWIVDAHRDNGKRFVVRSDEMLTAFLELERITHELAVSALLDDDSH